MPRRIAMIMGALALGALTGTTACSDDDFGKDTGLIADLSAASAPADLLPPPDLNPFDIASTDMASTDMASIDMAH